MTLKVTSKKKGDVGGVDTHCFVLFYSRAKNNPSSNVRLLPEQHNVSS